MSHIFVDLTDRKFGRLVVLEGPVSRRVRNRAAPNGVQTRTFWMCRCECKVEKEVAGASLISGMTQSCGCLKRTVNLQHGEARNHNQTAEYATHRSMISRCYYPGHHGYPWYGARGITVCDRWRFGEKELSGYQCFLADMGRKPSPDHSIEREKNSEGYHPKNCKWATWAEQGRNRSNNVRIDFKGETMILGDALKAAGIPSSTFRKYRAQGRTSQQAFDFWLSLHGKSPQTRVVQGL